MKKVYCIFLFLSIFNLAAEQPAIKVGYITDLSGKAAIWGTQSTYGAKLAQSELISAGIPTELYIEDSKNDPATAVTAAKYLLEQVKVDVIFSDLTPITIAISSSVKTAGKLFVHLSLAKSVNQNNPYSFLSFIDYHKSCRMLAEKWKADGLKKLGMLKINLEFGEDCLSGAREVYPDIKEIAYNSSDDLKSIISRFKTLGIEAYIQTGYEIDVLNRIQAANQINYEAPAACTDIIISELVREKAGKSLERDIFYGFEEVSPEFRTLFLNENPQRNTINIQAAALAYMHVKQAVRAVNACKERADVVCQSEALKNSPSEELLSFSGWKNRESDLKIIFKIFRDGVLIPLTYQPN